MSNGKLLLFYNKDKNVLCLYFNLAIFPHIIFYFILILEYVVDSVRLGLCGSSASFLCLWGYKDGMSLHDMFGCSHVPNKHTHTLKLFLRHIFVEALQLVSLLSQRRVQVQIVSTGRQLEGAVFQLMDTQTETYVKIKFNQC